MWHPQVVTRAFSRLVERTKLPRISFHGLRHTHIIHVLATGRQPRVVSERAGHSSVAFTQDRYAHMLPGQQAEAAAAAETMLRQRVTNL